VFHPAFKCVEDGFFIFVEGADTLCGDDHIR
jgi:hypothetical protein